MPPGPVDPTVISLGDSGQTGNAAVTQAAMSDDGNIVVFVSTATDLVAGPSAGTPDLYLRDRSAGTTIRIAEGVRSLSQVTPNGRFVSYTSFVDGEPSFSVYDVTAGTTQSWSPSWESTAGDLLVVDSTGSAVIYGAHRGMSMTGTSHCFVRDLTNGSPSNCPTRGTGIGQTGLIAVSANARYVLYTWTDEDDWGLNETVLWDRQSNTTTAVTLPTMPLFSNATFTISDDGSSVVGMALDAVVVDGESTYALFIAHVDLTDGTTTVLDHMQVLGGTSGGGVVVHAISPDGRRVVLQSYGHPFDPVREDIWSDVYIWEIATNSVERVATDLPAGEPNATTLPCAGASMLADGSGMCVIVAGAMGESPEPTDSDAWLVARP